MNLRITRHATADHDRARELAATRLDEALAAGDAAWLEDHFAACPDCRAVATEYDGQRSMFSVLRLDAPEPPRDLWARTAAVIDAQGAGRSRRIEGWLPRSIPLAPVAGLMIIAIAVGAGLLNGRGLFPGGSGNGEGPMPTPIDVAATDVSVVSRGADGTIQIVTRRLDQVCPMGVEACGISTSSGVTTTASIDGSANLDAIFSPSRENVVVVQRGAGATGVYVLNVRTASPSPVPTPSATAPAATPAPTATPGVSAEPATQDPGVATASPTGSASTATPEPTATPGPVTSEPPTATPMLSAEPEPTATPSVSAEPEPTATPSVSAEPEPTATPSVSAEPEPTATPSVSAEPEPTATPSVSAEPEPTATPSVSAEPEPTATPSVSAEPTAPVPTPVIAVSPTPGGPLEIASDVIVVGSIAAYAPDGSMFAFTARPADGSAGPDVYVWTVGDAGARAVTTDHASVFSSWLDGRLLVSRVEDGKPVTVLVDPATGAETPVDGDPTWRPSVAPRGQTAVWWDGTVKLADDGFTPVPGAGRLVLAAWPAGGASGKPQVLHAGPLTDWDVHWDEDGTVLAAWTTGKDAGAAGSLSLYALDAASGRADLDHPLLDGAPAFAGFSLEPGRLVWSAPADGGNTTVKVFAWSGDSPGTLELPAEQGATVVH